MVIDVQNIILTPYEVINMPNELIVKLLNKNDYLDYKAIRLEMLWEHPTSFGSSYNDIALKNDNFFKNCITEEEVYIFGTFINNDLIGVAGLEIPNYEKVKHKGHIFGVYVKTQYQGKLIASKLIELIINFAKDKIMYLELSCETSNFSAYKLYKKFNFEVTAIDKYSIKYENEFYDDYIMRLYLNSPLNQI